MTIREYKPADRKQCIEIFKSNVPRFFTETEVKDFEVWLNGQDEGYVAYDNAQAEHYFVAEQKDKIIACGGFYISRANGDARMTWGMVENSFHKKGFGKKLLEHRVQLIESLHPGCRISLDTTQHSFEFFERMGFVTTKVTKDFYAEGLDRYDMVRESPGQ